MLPKESILYYLIQKYKAQEGKVQHYILCGIVGGLILLFILLAMIVGGSMSWTDSSHSSLYLGIHIGLPITVLLYVMILIIVIVMLTKGKMQNTVVSIDPVTGRKIMKYGGVGTSNWMSADEAKEKFNVSPIEETDTYVYGQMKGTPEGTAVVSDKPSPDGSVEEHNLIVFGNPGTGKTVAIVYNAIFQAVRNVNRIITRYNTKTGKPYRVIDRGCSFVVSDPKGEIRQETISMVRDPVNPEEGMHKGYGYKTYTFNLKDTNKSDGWDCLSEVIDPATERLDSKRLNSFVKIYFDNTAEVPNETAYWREGAGSFMKALIGAVTWLKECYIKECYKPLLQKVSNGDSDLVERYFKSNVESLVLIENVIKKTALKNGYDEIEIEDEINEIKSAAPSATFDDVYYWSRHVEEVINIFSTMPDDHPGKLAWDDISNAYANVPAAWNGFESGLHNRLKIFTDRNLRIMLSTPGIDLHKVNEERTGIYVVLEDGESTLSAISSLFYSFLLMDIKQEYDAAEDKSIEQQEIARENDMESDVKNDKLPVSIILDEMYSVGVLGGLPTPGQPTWLARILATTRSRKIFATMIFQSYSQLIELYGEMAGDAIMNCCSNMMFLGSNGQMTLDFLSKYTGQTTVMSESHAETNTVIGNKTDDKSNIGSTSAFLITADEARRLPKREAILIHAREKPLRLKTFYYKNDPAYKMVLPTSIGRDPQVKSIDERVRNNEIRDTIFNIKANDETDPSELMLKKILDDISNIEPIEFIDGDGCVIENHSIEDTQNLDVSEIKKMTESDSTISPVEEKNEKESKPHPNKEEPRNRNKKHVSGINI